MSRQNIGTIWTCRNWYYVRVSSVCCLQFLFSFRENYVSRGRPLLREAIRERNGKKIHIGWLGRIHCVEYCQSSPCHQLNQTLRHSGGWWATRGMWQVRREGTCCRYFSFHPTSGPACTRRQCHRSVPPRVSCCLDWRPYLAQYNSLSGVLCNMSKRVKYSQTYEIVWKRGRRFCVACTQIALRGLCCLRCDCGCVCADCVATWKCW